MNEQWDIFALQNEGEAATSGKVLGQSLWKFISDPTTRALYQQILNRIRSGRSLKFSLRCDAPSYGRLLQMEITPLRQSDEVEFRTITLAEKPRHLSQGGHAAHQAMPETMPLVCGWCNRFSVDDEWLEIEDALPRLHLLEYPRLPLLSHGICEDCYERMSGLVSQVS